MFKQIFLLLTLMLLLTPMSFATVYENQYCYNSSSKVTETMNDSSGSNVTTQYSFVNCAFGCDSQIGTCADPSTEFNYGYLVIFALAVGIGASIYMINVFGRSKESLKMFFLFFAIILMVGLLFSVGIMGQSYANTYIASGSNIAFKVGIALAWVLVFLLALLVIDFLKNLLGGLGKKDKNFRVDL